jgi:hypothetical protein
MLYPEGARLYFETLVPLDGALAALPLRLFGPLVAYNLVALAMLAASGLAAWALAATVSGSRAAGAVGGLVYASSPYLLNHLRVGHLGVVSAVWVPLALLALLRAVRTRRPRWILLSAVALAAAAYTDLQAGLALALLAPLLLVAEGWARPRALAGGSLSVHAAGLLALTLAAPLLVGALAEIQAEVPIAQPRRYAVMNSADLLAFVSPQPLHPLWGAVMRGWYREHALDLGHETVVYPGLVVVALATVGLATSTTRRPFWAVAAALLAALSVGPVIHLGGPEAGLALPFGLPTPYAVLQEMPFVAIGRTPARFMGPAMLALAVLAAAGVVALRERRPAWRPFVGPAAALLIVFEFLPLPFPTFTPHVPAGYALLAERGCGGPILELPAYASGPDQKKRLFFQALHGCSISGGYVSRGAQDTALMRALERAARPLHPDPERARALASMIRALGFQYVVVWKSAYVGNEDAHLRRDLELVQMIAPQPPVFEDDESAVFLLTG